MADTRVHPCTPRMRAAALVLLSSGLAWPAPAPAQTVSSSASAAQSWLGWGGPRHNFTSDVKGLANVWPPEGPKRMWSRPLGEGHSSIIGEAGRLYTMYRPPTGIRNKWKDEEVVIALDAASGKTIWEYRYPASLDTMNFSRGAGPHSTPLIAGSRLFAAATDKQFFALDKQTGKLLWSHSFVKEYNALPNQMRWAVKPGYSASPIAYKDTVIAMVGGPDYGVVAFRQDDGRVVWHAGSFSDIAPASPLIISLDGQEQLVVTTGDGLHGYEPNTGKPLWEYLFPTRAGVNISSPVWCPEDRLLFHSAAYDGGSRVLELTRSGDRTVAKELWFSNKMRVHFGNVLRIGDFFIGSSGDFGPSFLTAINARTGQIAWQDRSFAKVSFVLAEGKVILLDEDGNLGLATMSPEGIKVLARATVATATSWTVPTLIVTTLYLRDRVNIMALDVGGR
ncbi:MAG TPA: PQQ-binding-like beta-propeller repeat protein [Blastocatellia bacterium]|nr:PQQ-binding-like beta-propeller repeat protein [Blastocatellia bacterium]